MANAYDLRLVWVDCEVLLKCVLSLTAQMTGLQVGKDKIIEVAVIITDTYLNPVDDEGFERVIHRPMSEMQAMDEWCVEHHGQVIGHYT